MRNFCKALGLLIALSLSSAVVAQDKLDAPDLPNVEADEKLMDAISEIGLIGGHAMQCDPQNEVLGTQALKVGDRISNEFGPHEAYLFMVYVGVGTTETIELKNCTERKKAWTDFLTEENIQQERQP
jgi:hypothetical protein